MKRILGFLASGRRAPVPPFDAPLRPDEPLALIGDVHGCDLLLARLLEDIETLVPDHRVVVLGDMIDRGDDSAAVLRRLMALPGSVCLRGNHEDMLLRYLDEPERAGRGWLRNGGLQTVASFGVPGLSLGAGPEALRDAAERLRDAMGQDMLAWLRGLPLSWRSGNVLATHAGADPRRSPEDQDETVLLWGHPRFEAEPRRDGVWVVHGHVIRPDPSAEGGRIAVDTGAYATGRLTMAIIRPGAGEFVTT